VVESLRPHGLWFIDVSKVHYVWLAHYFLEPRHIEPSKLVPLSNNYQHVASTCGFVLILAVFDIWQNPPRCLDSRRIISPNLGSCAQQILDYLERGSFSDVIGFRLECQSENCNRFAFELRHKAPYALNNRLSLLIIHVQRGFDNQHVIVDAATQRNKRLRIFWKTTPSESRARMQKLRADANIHSHSFRNVMHIRSKQFA